MSKRNRFRKPARHPSYIEPKLRLLVVSEGAVTEKEYIRGLQNLYQNPRVDVVVIGGAGVPRTVVETAKDEKRTSDKRARREEDENLSYDEIWCVFDVDDHPNLNDAKQMAIDNGFELAISNPCVELWLLLHFRPNPGTHHRQQVTVLLKDEVPGYDKHVEFSLYAGRYPDAVVRAQQLDQLAESVGEPGRNPSTGFWRLSESVRANA